MVTSSPSPTPNSCRILEVFDLKNATAVAGANLLVDFMINVLQIHEHLGGISFSKAHWSTYTLVNEIETLLCAYALGYERIFHIEELESDPLLCRKLGVQKLPDTTVIPRE